VPPCFKNLLRLEAGDPALRCHNLNKTQVTRTIRRRLHLPPQPQRLEIIPPGFGLVSEVYPKPVLMTMASARTTLTPTPTSTLTNSIVTTKIFFALTDSRSSLRSLTPDLLAQWRASSNNALLFPVQIESFPRISTPLYAFCNRSCSVHYLASSLVLAFPLGLLRLLPVRTFCSVSTARRASRAA